MVFLNVAKGRIRHQPPAPKRVSAEIDQQRKWHRAMLEFVGTSFVLVGLGIGLLTLRFVLVLMHGMLH
jgi:hypothetical protein